MKDIVLRTAKPDGEFYSFENSSLQWSIFGLSYEVFKPTWGIFGIKRDHFEK